VFYLIATLTLHNAINYGAILQAYALQQFLLGSGLDTELINYYPNLRKLKPKTKRSLWQKIVHEVSKIPTIPTRASEKRKIEKFKIFNQEFLRVSKDTFRGDGEIIQNPPQYDTYIAGSDQIWNSNITNNSKAFFLNFITSGKKIAYAASFGKSQLDDEEMKNIRKYLSDFDFLSVREQEHKKMLSDILGLSAQLALDPVFLLNREEWSEIAKSYKLPKKFVLVYVLEYSEEMFDYARKIAKKLNCKIVYLSLYISRKINGKVLKEIGPREFLDIISHASYVCTNSFHGTAFSIIFERNFTVFGRATGNSRIENIIELAGLKERWCDLEYNKMEAIDYQKVNNAMAPHIMGSKQFIFDAVGKSC
jgi:hypothetical protein